MNDISDIPAAELHSGLAKIRRRRWFLWLLIWLYLPLMMLAMQQSQQALIGAFAGWLLLLIVAVALLALVRCPACGNCYHMSGVVFRPVRRCFSCGLALSADKKKRS